MKKIFLITACLILSTTLLSGCNLGAILQGNSQTNDNSSNTTHRGAFSASSEPEPTKTPKPAASASAKPSPSATAKPAAAPTPAPTVAPTTAPVTQTDLSTAELSYFSQYFSGYDTYGFLLSTYTSPVDIDLKQVFYAGAYIKGPEPTQAEVQDYLAATGAKEVYDYLIKLTSAQINALLTEKAGVTMNNLHNLMFGKYLAKYDAYFFQVGDTNYTSFTADSGYKTSDGKVVVKCSAKGVIKSCTVTLKQSGDKYLFVANQITG